MSNTRNTVNTYTIEFGRRCTVIPGAAAEKIINGHAGAGDVRVLLAALELSTGTSTTANPGVTPEAIASLTGLAESVVENAMAFWRGCGVVSVSMADNSEMPTTASSTAPTSVPVSGPQSAVPSAAAKSPDEASISPRKPLKASSAPKYSGTEISDMLDKDGGALKAMIDECQQLIGHIFNPSEISTVVGMCDWLGLSPEFIITVAAYYTRKKPGCSVRYLERAATDLVNGGVTTMETLDAYLRDMELYDGVAGKLRSWLGIGSRAYTQKENGMIKRWVRDYGYGEDVVRLAYEITVDSRGAFNFDYAGKILENWYVSGVRDLDGAKAALSTFREEKKSKTESGGSFDTDEFFSLALKRSYKYMQGKDSDADNGDKDEKENK